MNSKEFFSFKYTREQARESVIEAIDKFVVAQCSCGKDGCKGVVRGPEDWNGVHQNMRASHEIAGRLVRNVVEIQRAAIKGELDDVFFKDQTPAEWQDELIAISTIEVAISIFFKDLTNGTPPTPADKYLEDVGRRTLEMWDEAMARQTTPGIVAAIIAALSHA